PRGDVPGRQGGQATPDGPDLGAAGTQDDAERQAGDGGPRRARRRELPPECERGSHDARRTGCPRPSRGVAVQPLGGARRRRAAPEHYMSAPLHLKTLAPDEVRFILERDARLLVPVGTCEQHGPHLPLGCDSIIVERLADDLSAEFEIRRAPTLDDAV